MRRILNASLAILAGAPLPAAEPPPPDYPALVAERARLRREAGEKMQQAHRALDERRLDTAAALAKEADALEGRARALSVLIDAALREILKDAARLDRDYAGLAGEIEENLAAAARRREEARERFGQGKYDEAVAIDREARALADDAEGKRARIRGILERLVPALVSRLDDDDFEVRERATARLKEVRDRAIPMLLRLRCEVRSPEARGRIDDVLGPVRVDGEGRIRQWAEEASASSEYGNPAWSAARATGPPDVPAAGDAQNAWTTKAADGGEEWLRLSFPVAIRIARVRIHQNLNPGGITSIDILDARGGRRRAWQGRQPPAAAPAVFEVDVDRIPGREIVITLNTSLLAGWDEIDAVELVGEPLEP